MDHEVGARRRRLRHGERDAERAAIAAFSGSTSISWTARAGHAREQRRGERADHARADHRDPVADPGRRVPQAVQRGLHVRGQHRAGVRHASGTATAARRGTT